MTVQYLGVEEAIKRGGLRMVVVGDVPSPWGEAAKGFLHIKGIEWAAVRLVYDSEPLKDWAGQRSGPVALLIGTKRMLGRFTASQIASASAASVLCLQSPGIAEHAHQDQPEK
jgi:hypothetical protein